MREQEAPSGSPYIYVIGHDDGPQKIGISNHPPTRARVLKVTGQPHYTVHFATLVAEADALGIERLAHWILRDRALGRERFDVTPDQAQATIEDAVARYGAGERTPPSEDLMTERVALKVPQSFVDEVEEWRKRQPGKLVTWSEAVRILVTQALDAREPNASPAPSRVPKPPTPDTP